MKWKYKRETNLTDEELDDIGLEGWELVSVVYIHCEEEESISVYYFKKKF